ncbi:MAG TPA: hypothetical protein VF183_01150 [Acidimicrobiales bacterium]
MRSLRFAAHGLARLSRRHRWVFAIVTGAAVFGLGLLVDAALDGHVDRPLTSAVVAIGWVLGLVAAGWRSKARPRATSGRRLDGRRT